MNIQNDKGKAKAYQVRQVLVAIEKLEVEHGGSKRLKMVSVTRFIEASLRLTVNARKSAVDRSWKRTFLSFTVSRNRTKLKVAEKAIDKLKAQVRELTRRSRGRRLDDIITELRDTLLGWKAYFGVAEVLSPLRDIDKWARRKLRCYLWKQRGRSGYRELRRRGVTVCEAWHTSKEAEVPTAEDITITEDTLCLVSESSGHDDVARVKA